MLEKTQFQPHGITSLQDQCLLTKDPYPQVIIFLGKLLKCISIYNKIVDMSKSKEYGAQLYDAAVLTAGAVGKLYPSRKLTKDTSGVPMTLGGAARIALRE